MSNTQTYLESDGRSNVVRRSELNDQPVTTKSQRSAARAIKARDIYKKLRSTSASRNKRREYIYIIQRANLDEFGDIYKRKVR